MWHPGSPRRRLSALLPLLSLFAAGCTDPIDPDPQVTVQIRAASLGFSYTRDAEGLLLRCGVELTATATGNAGEGALWEDLTVRFMYGADRRTPVDSLRFPVEEVQATWGAERIRVGETLRAPWHFWARVPFSLTGEMRYRVEGARRSQSAPFEVTCGPEVPADGVPAPTIHDVRLEPAALEYEPGPDQRLRVTFTANSSLGLWEMGVRVSGAFRHETVERVDFSTAATRTLEIPVPASATLGERIRVQVYARDAALQEHSRTLVDGPALVDRTPPQVTELFLDPTVSGTTRRLAGDFSSTDTLRIRVVAGDNHRLSHIVYSLGEPASFRDSIAVPVGSGPGQSIDLPIRSEWVGSPILTVQAVDAAGLRSAPRGSLPDSIRIFPVVPRSTRALELDSVFHDVALDPGRDRLYLALPRANALEVVSLSSMTSLARIRFPARVSGVDLSPDGGTLAVALVGQGAVALVDPDQISAEPRMVALDSATYGEPWTLRYRADGKLIVLAARSGQGRIVELDPATGRQTARTEPIAGWWFDSAAVRTGDFATMVLTISRGCSIGYSASTDRFTPCRRLADLGSLSVSADGERIAKGYQIYDRALDALHGFSAEPFGTYTTGLSPDGAELFIGTRQGLLRRRIADGRPVDRTPLPPAYDGRVLFARGGKLLLVIGRYPDLNPTHTRVHAVEFE